MRKSIFLLCGIPGSGKTTWAKSHIDEKTEYISRDEVRYSLLKDGDEYFSKETEVFKMFKNKIKEAIKNSKVDTIIIDATHLNKKSRDKTLYGLNLENCILYVVNFILPLQICLYRNSKREGRARVPETEVIRMFKTFVPAKLEENEKYTYILREY